MSVVGILSLLLVACGSDPKSLPKEDTIGACDDHADNDGDGHVDCADQDCRAFAICLGGADAGSDADGDTDVDAGGACDAARVECDGECVDTETDPSHCGDCATACTPEVGPECAGGHCVCRGDARACAGTPEDTCCDDGGRSFCVDTTSNDEHCGGCEACSAGEICDGGTCVTCGTDCWGRAGCLTNGGRCIRFTCRSGDDTGDFCRSCMGWEEVTYSQWLDGGYCEDVSRSYRWVAGTDLACGTGAPSCCESDEDCGNLDAAWHFDRLGTIRMVGPNLATGADVDCRFWDEPTAGAYTRLTVCEHPL